MCGAVVWDVSTATTVPENICNSFSKLQAESLLKVWSLGVLIIR